MGTNKLVAAVAALLITVASAYAADDDATVREIKAMHWQPGTIVAAKSHSKLTPGADFVTVAGAEAVRFRELADVRQPGLEADAVDITNDQEILYEYFDEGYVSIEDWENIDADALLTAMKEKDVEANKTRREHGISELHTTGWIERPSLNRDTNTVSWIIEGVDTDNVKTINAVALKLGRNGFEKIVWIAKPDAALDGFRNAINSHEFDPGYRYVDHVASDRVAAYGVAGLVAGVLGVKLAKAVAVGGGVALVVLAKKLGFLIVLPFLALGRGFRRVFSRKRPQA